MSEPLRQVNQSIRDLAANLSSHDVSDWEFVCECGDRGCTETVGLALALYDDLKDADVALLAPGHALKRSA
jgi:predicted NBD/HSP70 family sugar kinase